jgi:hypothetical protein
MASSVRGATSGRTNGARPIRSAVVSIPGATPPAGDTNRNDTRVAFDEVYWRRRCPIGKRVGSIERWKRYDKAQDDSRCSSWARRRS